MLNTSDAFTGCNFYATPQQYAISEKQKYFIEAAADWIVAQVKNVSKASSLSAKLPVFRQYVIDFLTDRFRKLGCANLRTIGSNAQLYSLATKVGIPCNALPENVSIIINKQMCYYLKGDSQHRHIIESY